MALAGQAELIGFFMADDVLDVQRDFPRKGLIERQQPGRGVPVEVIDLQIHPTLLAVGLEEVADSANSLLKVVHAGQGDHAEVIRPRPIEGRPLNNQ